MPEKPAVQSSPVVRNRRDTVVGVVTSARAAKTITVVIERFVQHPTFGKFLKKSTTCYAHDEKGEAKEGDRVEIMSTRPLSRLKRWRLVKVVEKGAEEIVRRERPEDKGKPAEKGAKAPEAPKAAAKPAKPAEKPKG
jgi:small subunit ribosomal protein S17